MAAPAEATGERRKGKMEERLRLSLTQRDYYSALQTIKVLYSRCNLQGKKNECISLLYNGATELLIKDQVLVSGVQ